MSKNRYIDTKFWSDNYIAELDPIEKLLFLYLLTNEKTSICGIYELPLKYMAVETGIERDMLLKILKRFERDKKVFFYEGWVCIANFIKHQHNTNEKINRGIVLCLQQIPEKILKKFMSHGWVIDESYMSQVCVQNYSNSNSNSNTNEQVDDLFNEFWASYPKKKSKPAALRAFKRLNSTQSLLDTILKDIEKKKQTEEWKKQNGQFIPYPATYLNQRRWEDEDEDKLPAWMCDE